MLKATRPGFGFEMGTARPARAGKLEAIGLGAARKKFTPEFMNRIDRTITYQPLTEEALAAILDRHIEDFQKHIGFRLGVTGPVLVVPPETRRELLRQGTSIEFGARELQRTLHRHLIEPLAELVVRGLEPGAAVRLEADLSLTTGERAMEAGA